MHLKNKYIFILISGTCGQTLNQKKDGNAEMTTEFRQLGVNMSWMVLKYQVENMDNDYYCVASCKPDNLSGHLGCLFVIRSIVVVCIYLI